MSHYVRAGSQAAYQSALAGWEASDPLTRGDAPAPPVQYSSHSVEDAPEEIHARNGHSVAMVGMLVFEGNTAADDRFVVHPDDAANASLWEQI